ncbi:MAG: glycosyltransferase family 4 protein [Desulfurococcaceae archaeon]|jgi:glycosyltransferase involved in cell wall biosynthesis|nr:glycosyltransferase family 4 protein [Desulfurococcaceae archaeon]
MRETLRILYLIDHLETNYPRDQNYIIKFMMDRGHEVEIITTTNRRYQVYDALFFPTARILRYPIAFKVRKASVYIHLSILHELLRDFDAVHSFTFFTFSSVLGIFAKANIKVIRSEIGEPQGLNFTKAKKGIYSTLVHMYKNSYSYVTAYNYLEAKSLELLGFPRSKIVLLPPMIDFKMFSSLRKPPDHILNIGVISRISPEKGIHRVVPIVKELIKDTQSTSHKFRLILAGRADEGKYASNILSSLQKLLGSRFIYLGEVALPYRFYKMVDVVIVPSLHETGAIAVLEAMAAGKCVVASNIYPINVYISHGVNGFLFNTPSEAAKIVSNILTGSIDIERVSAKAQECAKNHDYRVVCKVLEQIYCQGSKG